MWIILVLILLVMLAAAVEARDCDDCHGTAGGYTFVPLGLNVLTARTVEEEIGFDHSVEVVHPGSYDAKEVSVTITVTGDLQVSNDLTQTIADFSSGTKSLIFMIEPTTGGASGTISTVLTYTADYHYEPTVYTETVQISISIGSIALEPSLWSIIMDTDEQQVVTFTAQKDLENIDVVTTDATNEVMTLVGDAPTSLSSSNSFDITVKGIKSGTGTINIMGEDSNGKPFMVSVDVTVNSVANTGNMKGWLIAGRVLAFLSYFGLIFSIIVGAPIKPMKKALNKVFGGAAVRKKFHCWQCYSLGVLALLHAVVLMAISYESITWGGFYLLAEPTDLKGIMIDLGTIGWVAMVLVSVQGFFQKTLVKGINYKVWRFTHLALMKIALITITIHSIYLFLFVMLGV